MFLSEPRRSAYDLNFRLFGVPVCIHPVFWLLGFIMAFNYFRHENGFLMVLAFIGCMLLSLLVHEFGHVGMYAAFGVRSRVLLYGLGGLAMADGRPAQRWQRVLVSLAGPAAGFLLFAAVALTLLLMRGQLDNPDVEFWLVFILGNLFFMNLWWNLLNLVPIFPLDGGQVSREACCWLSPWNGKKISLVLSLALAALIALGCLIANMNDSLRRWLPFDPVFCGILFALLAVENWQSLQQEEQFRRRWGRQDGE